MSNDAHPHAQSLKAVSSMATRQAYAALARQCLSSLAIHLDIEAVGGVDAARRVAAGECFDLVLLASDALEKLHAGSFVGSRVDLMRSSIAVAIKEGDKAPDLSSAAAVRQAVIAARSVGYSSGPSGVYLQQLFDQWQIAELVAAKLVTPAPGVPVASLITQGQVSLGFQQYSELAGVPGITIVGGLPNEIAYITTFSGAVATTTQQADLANRVLQFFAEPVCQALIERYGMQAVNSVGRS
jgi:molybdate transport system substrate-binding protein